jgi:calcium-independent phospholipase A2
LALGLAKGLSLKKCQCLYFEIKNNTFVGGRPYSTDSLDKTLKDYFGEKTTMSSIQHPKIMVTSVLADRRPIDLHIFRNYESPEKICWDCFDVPCIPSKSEFKETQSPQKQLLWKAARASGSAPCYFRPFGRFLDGGLIANNPTLDAITEIHEYNVALKYTNRDSEITPLSLVVSLGTGLIPVTTQSFDLHWDLRLSEAIKSCEFNYSLICPPSAATF